MQPLRREPRSSGQPAKATRSAFAANTFRTKIALPPASASTGVISVPPVVLSLTAVPAVSADRSRAALPGSPYTLKSLCVLLPAPHINVGRLQDPLSRLFIESAHRARGRADDQRAIRELLAFSNQRVGADKAAATDARTVKNNGSHADEGLRTNTAPMQHDVVADDAVLTDDHGKSGIGVQCRIVLNLGTLPQFDPFVVAAHDGIEPDARIRFQSHAADDHGALGNPIAPVGGQIGLCAVKLENCHLRIQRTGDRLRSAFAVPHINKMQLTI